MSGVLNTPLFTWLRSYGLSKNKVVVTSTGEIQLNSIGLKDLENGQIFHKVLASYHKRISQSNGVIPPLDLTANPQPSTKLYNWNIVEQLLHRVGYTLGNETKTLIVAGDTDMTLNVLCEVHKHLQTLTPRVPPQPTAASDGAKLHTPRAEHNGECEKPQEEETPTSTTEPQHQHNTRNNKPPMPPLAPVNNTKKGVEQADGHSDMWSLPSSTPMEKHNVDLWAVKAAVSTGQTSKLEHQKPSPRLMPPKPQSHSGTRQDRPQLTARSSTSMPNLRRRGSRSSSAGIATKKTAKERMAREMERIHEIKIKREEQLAIQAQHAEEERRRQEKIRKKLRKKYESVQSNQKIEPNTTPFFAQFRGVTNKKTVLMVLDIIDDLLDDVHTGKAHERLAEMQRQKALARQVAKKQQNNIIGHQMSEEVWPDERYGYKEHKQRLEQDRREALEKKRLEEEKQDKLRQQRNDKLKKQLQEYHRKLEEKTTQDNSELREKQEAERIAAEAATLKAEQRREEQRQKVLAFRKQMEDDKKRGELERKKAKGSKNDNNTTNFVVGYDTEASMKKQQQRAQEIAQDTSPSGQPTTTRNDTLQEDTPNPMLNTPKTHTATPTTATTTPPTPVIHPHQQLHEVREKPAQQKQAKADTPHQPPQVPQQQTQPTEGTSQHHDASRPANPAAEQPTDEKTQESGGIQQCREDEVKEEGDDEDVAVHVFPPPKKSKKKLKAKPPPKPKPQKKQPKPQENHATPPTENLSIVKQLEAREGEESNDSATEENNQPNTDTLQPKSKPKPKRSLWNKEKVEPSIKIEPHSFETSTEISVLSEELKQQTDTNTTENVPEPKPNGKPKTKTKKRTNSIPPSPTSTTIVDTQPSNHKETTSEADAEVSAPKPKSKPKNKGKKRANSVPPSPTTTADTQPSNDNETTSEPKPKGKGKKRTNSVPPSPKTTTIPTVDTQPSNLKESPDCNTNPHNDTTPVHSTPQQLPPHNNDTEDAANTLQKRNSDTQQHSNIDVGEEHDFINKSESVSPSSTCSEHDEQDAPAEHDCTTSVTERTSLRSIQTLPKPPKSKLGVPPPDNTQGLAKNITGRKWHVVGNETTIVTRQI